MSLGSKIKSCRLQKKMTQSQLCDGKITRNLLSEIECDKASPSIGTLKFIAMRLELPLSYLLSEKEDLSFYLKHERIDDIKTLFEKKEYKKCINLINSINSSDDELNYILAYCHFELGRDLVLRGSLKSGYDNLSKAAEFSAQTVYDTSRITSLVQMYASLAKNIQSPLLEFDSAIFLNDLDRISDFELYKYLTQDHNYSFKSTIFSNHMKAKELIKSRKYSEAVALLSGVENMCKSEYNAHVVFSVYCDLESCYKQLADFENAYRYASKKLSLIEGFKS